MTTITKERLQEIAEDGFLKHGEGKEMARMLLAGMEQEPVAYAVSNDFWAGSHKKTHIDGRYCDLFHRGECDPGEYDHVYPLYAAPQPVPVVPDEISTTDAMKAMSGRIITMSVHTAYKKWLERLPRRHASGWKL